MTASRKYEATGPEAETQPGSRGRVLRNLRGIARVREMDVAEARALQTAMSKDGFPFATAALIPELMQKLQKRILARVTPCRFAGREEVAGAMAEAHVELVLIHPFRDGNGRVARARSQVSWRCRRACRCSTSIR